MSVSCNKIDEIIEHILMYFISCFDLSSDFGNSSSKILPKGKVQEQADEAK